MANTKLIIALFDLDGTLCEAHHLAGSLIRYQFRHLTRIPRVVLYLMIQTARIILWKAGLMSYVRVVEASSQPFARLLKSLRTSEAHSLFCEAAQKTVDTARGDTLSILRWHQEEGHTVIMTSGGFLPFLQDVANLLGIKHTVGTALEEVDDCYTGRLTGPFCYGDNRVHLIRHLFEECGFDVDLSSSYAYGDRFQDIAMLEMVGHPRAVYPDKELLDYANERDWTVIGVSHR